MARPAALAALPDPESRPAHPAPARITTPHELQAAVEGVPAGRDITFMGQTYKVAPSVGAVPYLRFTWAAKNGLNFEDMEGMASVFEMLRDCFVVTPACGECDVCIDPERGEPCPTEDLGDWPRFDRDAVRKKASIEDVMDVIKQAVEVMAARPTSQLSDSSGGPSTTSANSTDSSSLLDTGGGAERLISVDDLWKQASS